MINSLHKVALLHLEHLGRVIALDALAVCIGGREWGKVSVCVEGGLFFFFLVVDAPKRRLKELDSTPFCSA